MPHHMVTLFEHMSGEALIFEDFVTYRESLRRVPLARRPVVAASALAMVNRIVI